jgi:macrolide transport system ATP-binding/permease protein
MTTLIELTGVWRTYHVGGEDVHALQDVSLTIDEGDFVAIVGPSGSGKSSLMYLLGLLDRPTRGSYRLGGQEVVELSDRALSRLRNREIGYVFQAYNLLPGLSVIDNIALGRVYAGSPGEERRAAAGAFARELGLGHRLGHTARELSGGQMQRVAIARGLAGRPHLILADEPTGNLDTRTGAEILGIFRRLHAEGHTIVVVTHDPGVAAQADRAIRIVDGRVVDDHRNDHSGEPTPPPLGDPAAPPPSARPAAGLAQRRLRGDAGGVTPADLLRVAAREGLLAHRLRTALAILGIVFGIAAVIAMTAITEGGKEEQLAQIRRIGLNNITVRALEVEGARLARLRRLNPDGLAERDLDGLRAFLPGVQAACAWRTLKAEVRHEPPAGATGGGEPVIADDTSVQGVTGEHADVTNLAAASGRLLTAEDESQRRRVCVLGAAVAEQLGSAPGASVTIGDERFAVVGVAERRGTGMRGVGGGGGDRDREVYLPLATLRAYFRQGERDSRLDVVSLRMDSDAGLLDRAEEARRLVLALHREAEDIAVVVPLEAMRQAQRTKEVFNVIITVIAAIALVVGGIGIMNIMLASVTERTREIGIRRAVGASRADVLRQFLAEAMLISGAGAVIGLAAGIGAGLAVQAAFGFPVAFNGAIMVVAVATSVLVGIGFGIYPAWKAACMDPVEALRT